MDTFPSPTAPSPIPEGPAMQGYKLTGPTVQNWISNGASLPAAFSAARNIDQNFSQGVARMSADAKAKGLPYDYNDPAFITRAFRGAYGIGPTPQPNNDMAALLGALKQTTTPAPAPAPQPQKPGFLQTVGQGLMAPVNAAIDIGKGVNNDMNNATQDILTQASHVSNPQDNPAQMFAKNIIPTMGAFGAGVANAVSEPLKPIGEAVTNAAMQIPGVKEALGMIQQGASQLQQAHPELARQLLGGAKIASLPLAVSGTESALGAGTNAVQNIGKAGVDTVNAIAQGAKDNVITPTTDVAKSLANRVLAVDQNKIDAATQANEAYKAAATAPKTTNDISIPARSRANDLKALDNNTAIIENGKVVGYQPNSDIAKTLSSTVTDPNNIPQSMVEIKKGIGDLSNKARSELTRQVNKINPILQTKSYQDAAVKEVRSALSSSMEDNAVDLVGDGETPQKMATLLENKYAELLKQAKGEKEIAKLDLRQWVDQKIPNSAYAKDLAELPAATRSLMIYRDALNKSIEDGAQSIGGEYSKYMKQITNLFRAQKIVGTHLPAPESLEQRFTLPGELPLPNKVPPTAGDIIKKTAKKGLGLAAKGAAVGAGLGPLTHLAP